MNARTLARIAGGSYLIIFVAAIFANFFALEALTQAPVEAVTQNESIVRFGILAFLIAVIFDVVVAWALRELYKNHVLTSLSTYFRLMHAAIFGVAIFTLPQTLSATTSQEILGHVNNFNTIWLIGLFFFGIHLIVLARIVKTPKVITHFLTLAGTMYMIDTAAHVLLPNYEIYASLFLAFVAVPSIIGELLFTVWLLVKGGKQETASSSVTM